MSKNYEAGRRIKNLGEFDKALENNTLLFIRHWKMQVFHPIILANMQYRVVKGFIEKTGVYIAKRINHKGGNNVTK